MLNYATSGNKKTGNMGVRVMVMNATFKEKNKEYSEINVKRYKMCIMKAYFFP